MDSPSISIYFVWELDRYLKMLFIWPELSNHFLELRQLQILVQFHVKTKINRFYLTDAILQNRFNH